MVAYVVDLIGSVIHAISLSIAIAQLSVGNPIGAVLITLVGVFCISFLALSLVGTQYVVFRIQLYIDRQRELEKDRIRLARHRLEDSNPE